MSLQSCIYSGEVLHRRFSPVDHSFRYRLFLLFVDLDELPNLFRRRWFWSARKPNVAWFRRCDHFGPSDQPLADSVRELVESRLGWRPTGPIRMLAHFRYFGFLINPVSFFYCFGNSGDRVEAIVAEVTNTPWKETHCYVLDAREQNVGNNSLQELNVSHAKEFHVSPFFEMDMEYRWKISAPGEKLSVCIENRTAGEKPFEASLQMRRRPMTGFQLTLMLVCYPLMTVQVAVGIYWQAVRLWMKRVPFVPHPANNNKSSDELRLQSDTKPALKNSSGSLNEPAVREYA